jgi:hypothetical protein
MAVEVIEGTLEPATPAHVKRGYGRYSSLRFDVPGAAPRTFDKVAAGPAMLREIERGGEGRYFMATADGAKALIGVRRPDGTATYAHYQNAEPIVLIGGLIGTACAVMRFGFGFGADIFLLPCLLGPPLLLGWFYLRSQRLAQKRAFDANGS